MSIFPDRSKRKRNTYRIVFYLTEEGYYIAHCLETDISMKGVGIDDTFMYVCMMMEEHRTEKTLSTLSEADENIFRLLEKSYPISIQHVFLPDDIYETYLYKGIVKTS